MISKHTENLLRQVPIDEVVGQRISIKRKGSKLWACCPFHNEKTPSFSISTQKNTFYCFGCHKTGGTISFVMEYDKLSFPEACRQLAKEHNISIEETEEDRQKHLRAKRLTKILQDYADLYHNTPNIYLAARGFSVETINKFYCGYSDSKFAEHYQSFKHDQELVMACGQLSKHNDKVFDTFRQRVIFPIHSFNGTIVGFGGRSLEGKPKIKYLNTTQTELYNKSYNLYGIYQAKKSIQLNDCCLLVEGYTDVMRMHQVGLDYTVAACGTALTKEQVRMIRRLTNNITLVYDGDEAGVKAMQRNLTVLFEQGMYVKVMILAEGEDPDTYFKRFENDHARATATILNSSLDVVSWLIKKAKNNPEKRKETIDYLKELLAVIPDNMIRQMYFEELDSKIGEYKGYLQAEVEKKIDAKPNTFSLPKQEKIFYLEARLLFFLLSNGSNPLHGTEHSGLVYNYIKKEMEDVFEQQKCLALQETLEIYTQGKEEGVKVDSNYIVANTSNPTILLMLQYLLAEHSKKTYADDIKADSANIFEYIHKYMLNIKLQCILEYIKDNSKQLNGEPENDKQVMVNHAAFVTLKNEIQNLLKL